MSQTLSCWERWEYQQYESHQPWPDRGRFVGHFDPSRVSKTLDPKSLQFPHPSHLLRLNYRLLSYRNQKPRPIRIQELGACTSYSLPMYPSRLTSELPPISLAGMFLGSRRTLLVSILSLLSICWTFDAVACRFWCLVVIGIEKDEPWYASHWPSFLWWLHFWIKE